MQRLTNEGGTTIGYIEDDRMSGDRTRVLDRNYRTVGWLTPRGTFNVHEQHLSTAKLPGLLLKD
jgi:hypothetical protein